MTDPDIAKLRKALEASVDLVRDLNGRLSPETQSYLVASSLGLMETYFELIGKPSAIGIIESGGDVKF